MSAEQKYDDEPRLPTFEEALTEERLLKERFQLMEATKQLARLQLEMETKVRAEMEAKIRAEMEAKMAGEVARMEEERKKEEERRQLEAMKTERHEKVLAELQIYLTGPSATGNTTLSALLREMLQFVKTRTVLMYIWTHYSNYSCGLYLSNTQVGFHILLRNGQTNTCIEEIRPFYWFDADLTQRDLTIWDNLEMPTGSIAYKDNPLGRIYSDTKKRKWSLTTILTHESDKYIEGSDPKWGHDNQHYRVEYLRSKSFMTDFQTILRLIPGGYKNGPWKQLDGFFGPYLNEETLEIISLVPELK
jgi:hypothetical protein